MKKLTIVFALLCVGLFTQAVSAQNKSGIDKQTFIKAVKILEQDPFIKDGKKYREALTFYLIETKDVTVTLCTDSLTEPLFDKKYKFSNELFGQNMFGMAVFKLENPDKANDEAAARLAGVESMLRTYEVMVKQNAKAKLPAADELIALRDKGELKAKVDAANCGKK
jgi:hypothetical protein